MSIFKKKSRMMLFKDMSLTTIENGEDAISIIEIKGIDGETVQIGVPKEGLESMVALLMEKSGNTYKRTVVTDDVMYLDRR